MTTKEDIRPYSAYAHEPYSHTTGKCTVKQLEIGKIKVKQSKDSTFVTINLNREVGYIQLHAGVLPRSANNVVCPENFEYSAMLNSDIYTFAFPLILQYELGIYAVMEGSFYLYTDNINHN
jgi:hypothetical protein